MYQIIKNNVLLSTEDELTFLKLNRNNIHIRAKSADATSVLINGETVLPLNEVEIRWVDGAGAINKMLPDLPDKTASNVAGLYPTLKQDGGLIRAGTRINWGGWLKQAAVDLWDTEANDPNHAPALWVKIEYKDGARVIPDIITAAEAFAFNELGWWDGNIYKSLIAANVYTPEQYPRGWELQE